MADVVYDITSNDGVELTSQSQKSIPRSNASFAGSVYAGSLYADGVTRGKNISDVEAAAEYANVHLPLHETFSVASTIDTLEDNSFLGRCCKYFVKFKGIPGEVSPDRKDLSEVFISFILSFCGIFLVSVTSYWYLSRNFHGDNNTAVIMLTGAYGATAVLLYDGHNVPYAQPRNVCGSYLVCSIIGTATRIICGYIGLGHWATAAIAVALGIVGMNLTKTTHPPGGAVALTAVIGGRDVWDLGLGFVPVTVGGTVIMVCVAIIGNNLSPTRIYPTFWW